MILDLQEHTVVFYALPMESNMYSIPAVFSITKTWFKIFSGPYITDMSLNLYPMLQISPAEPWVNPAGTKTQRLWGKVELLAS